jgi:hypothetical protein
MSTHCNVAIKLKNEDLDKTLTIIENKKVHELKTDSGYSYMFIYIHHDGYPGGVGCGLLNELGTDYETVKNYIMLGDRTSFDKAYCECGEKWEDDKPRFCKSIDGPMTQEYLYLFDNDKWFYKSYWDDDFKELTQEIIDND